MFMPTIFWVALVWTFAFALSAQVVLSPLKNSEWPGQHSVCKDSSEAQQKVQTELNRLQKRGYVLASVDSLLLLRDTLWVNLHKGIRWDYILVENPGMFSELPTTPQRLSAGMWSEIKEKKLKELQKAGYAQAKIHLRPKPESEGAGLLTIEAIIDLGPKLHYDSVQCMPATILSAKVLHHLSGVYPGSPADRRQIEEGSRSLSSAGLLQPGSVAKITQRGRKVDVEWPLRKAQTNRFSGILGLMPENNQTGGFLFTGELDLALENVLGYTEQLNLKWQRLQTSTQQLKVQAAWPYLLGTRLGCMGDFSLFRIDSAFTQIEGRTGLTWKPSGMSVLAGFVQFRQSTVAPGAENPSLGWLEASAVSAGLKWQHAFTDNPITPMTGHLLRFMTNTGERTFRTDTIGAANKALVFEIEAEAALIQPIYKRWIAYLRAHAWWLNSSNLLMSETRRLGGLHSLRGVDEESLYSTWFTYANTEIRYVFDRGSWFQVLFDLGRFGLELNQVKRSQWQIGLGGGLTFLTQAGSFSVVYALGIIPGESPGFGQSKIHIGYHARW